MVKVTTYSLTDYQTSLEKSALLVLTGAGASVPFGMPTMAEFRTHIDTQWTDLVDQIFPNKKEFDLERLLGVLAFYEEILDQYSRDPMLHSWIQFIGRSDLGGRARGLKNHVFDRIIELYGHVPLERQEKARVLYLPLYRDLLELCGNEPQVLPIFTTNYDLTFEALRRLDSGFTVNDGIRDVGYDREWAPEHYQGAMNYKYAIFRLHGCSHWMKNNHTGRILYQSQPDRKDPGNKEPAVLFPLLGKEVAVPHEPYATAYSYFRECLRAAHVILIVGYSGRDPLVQQYIADSLRRDTDKGIIVISKGNELRQEFKTFERFLGRQVKHVAGGIEDCNVSELMRGLEALGLQRRA
jgi:hypothetical protein